ncbi:MAG: DUF3472 domain-containing protein [Bacteroidetes bacterium]|nr:DUF3472 domain-containing protein [Bacteroidota bacterium]
MRTIYKLTVLLLAITFLSVNKKATGKEKHKIKPQSDTAIIVPLGGNAWRTDKDTLGGKITNDGIVDWTNPEAEFTAYVRFSKPGKFKMYLDLSAPKGDSSFIYVSVAGVKHLVGLWPSEMIYHRAGEWTVSDTGYVAITFKGHPKHGSVYANIKDIKLIGDAVGSKTNYVKNNDGDFFYWGRRGPSVHLNYTLPNDINAEWFYNEVTVPKGNDVLGSYFMACGFGEGYFGMQVNSPAERHILFSVWSPYKTDDPKTIPQDEKIIMLKKGENVHTGEFGNEGSGGQSYLNYMWKAGNTYRFLVHAKPDGKGRTQYTAYFYAPEVGKWQLIASFSRPKIDTYLKHLHSFLENFDPEQGIYTREVYFNNEWIRDNNGNWTELTKAKFTCDNTGAKGYRMDYAGGAKNGSFYLKNCGFFNNYTMRNALFDRLAKGKVPGIDLTSLP